MIRAILLLTILLTPLAPAAEMLPLESDDYTLTVTHEVWTPKVTSPDQEVPVDQYLPAKESTALRFRFSEDRKEIRIPAFRVLGKLTSGEVGKRVYQFTTGLSAGGSLTIEATGKGLVATFTKFGSGLPVISSERGRFEPTVRKGEQDGAGEPASGSDSKPEGETKAEPGSEGAAR